jgi:tetratricopeptide (TPR) repeat protein/tRNA A-37 threonylcarbamoyl transferase component Bud32
MTDEAVLSELLLLWEEGEQAGSPRSPEELCRDRPDLLGELRRRIAALSRVDRMLDTTETGGRSAGGAPEVPFAPARPRYRPVAPHAAGGLGEVFTAIDEELNREVALKRIRPALADDQGCRRRFLREAEVTGRLEHPGIVPVYGLGQDASGRAFYAMRFIRGETLHQAVERFHSERGLGLRRSGRNLAFHDLLGRFVAVCNTIAYAHGRGVLHRDLKPLNIMLGPYGETLVVDWGLARAGPDSPPGSEAGASGEGGATIGPVGTPAFMSPEQAEGRGDRVGPATDVFQLGATLYAILTGQAPYSGRTVGEVLARAREGRFPPPHTLKPDVPRALEAVCLKAMALRPADRYVSALDLAADLGHWLADEPVSAWREPLAARAGRWVRRHRTLVVAGTVAVLVALGGGSAALNHRNEARRQERAARQAGEDLQAVLDGNLRLAEELKGIAGTQRRSVEKVLRVVSDHYERVAPDAPRTVAVLERRGRVANAFADLYLDLGDTRLASRFANEAVETYGELARRDPEDLGWAAGLALARERVGVVDQRQGRSSEALARYREALALRSRLARLEPNNLARVSDLAASHSRVGDILQVRGDQAGAVAAYREALGLNEALARQAPSPAAYQIALARAWFNLGAVSAGEAQARAYQAASELLERLPTRTAESASLLALRFDLDIEQGNLLKAGGKIDEARACYGRCRDLASAVVRLDPDNLGWLRRHLYARVSLADLPGSSEPAPALSRRERLREYDRFRELLDAGRKQYPENTSYPTWLTTVLWQTALTLVPNSRPEKLDEADRARALEALREAVRIGERFVTLDPDNQVWSGGLATSHFLLATLLRSGGETKAADQARLRSIRVRLAFEERRAARDGDRPEWQRTLAHELQQLGAGLTGSGQFPEAAIHLRRAINIQTRLAGQSPDDLSVRGELGDGYNYLANALAGQNDHEGEVASHRQAIAEFQKLLEKAPTNRAGLERLVHSMQQSISALRSRGKAAEEREVFRRSRPFRARRMRLQVQAMTAATPLPGSNGVRAIRAMYTQSRIQETRQTLALRESMYRQQGGTERTIEMAEECLRLAGMLDVATKQGNSEACELLGRALDLYRQLREHPGLLKEEVDLVSSIEAVRKQLLGQRR